MSEPKPAGEARGEQAKSLGDSLGRLHRAILVVLVVCALAIVAAGLGGEDPPPDPRTTLIAIGLALGSIVFRRLGTSPVLQPGRAAVLHSIALLLAAGLGALGVLIAWSGGAVQTGLVYTLAGGIFVLRPPAIARR